MKKLVYLFTICSAMLIGCADEKTSTEIQDVQQAPLTNEQEKATEENNSTSEEQSSSKENIEVDKAEQVIPPEKAEEVLQDLVQTAQKDNVVKNVKIDDQKDEVTANITFNEEISDEERGMFLFNYTIFLKTTYPDQEVKVNIEE